MNVTISFTYSEFLSFSFAAQAKQKTDEAGRSEAKFLKMKAWSKSRIRQLEEEIRKSQVGTTQWSGFTHQYHNTDPFFKKKKKT